MGGAGTRGVTFGCGGASSGTSAIFCNVGTHWQSPAMSWTHRQSCAMLRKNWQSCVMSRTNRQCSNLIVVKVFCCGCPSEKAFLKISVQKMRTLFLCFAKKICSQD